MNGILLIAHSPLASALRQCALHVFPDAESSIAALDVHPNTPPDETLAAARLMLEQLQTKSTLVLSDVFGATPCNVAQRLVEGSPSVRLMVGVNLPMLLRAVCYRQEPLDALVVRAQAGGTQGIMSVATTAPQNQPRRATNDQERYDHQQ
ncbi:PTS sugar transporter subunit IIA [Ottowia thiooxydans]|uniref:PTS sugar transporter subunit IIA n=1 Tax=Ottowia thiooxydans TaxID=219182 RepID=UPI0003F4F1CA|nr:PTS fructose transporter subunit IIA [Ottowia thiooxydans]